MTICFACEYQDGSEEKDEDSVHEGVLVERGFNIIQFLYDDSKKLHNQLFELQIIKKFWILILIEDKFEIVVIQYFLNFVDMLVVILVLHLEA